MSTVIVYPDLGYTISDPSPGILRVTLSGEFYFVSSTINIDRYNGGGNPTAAALGDTNIAYCAYAGTSADLASNGAALRTPAIDRFNGSAFRDYAYPGGNVVWTLGVAELTSVNPSSGAYEYGIRKLKLDALLTKK